MCDRCEQYQKELSQLKKTHSQLLVDYHSAVQRIHFLERQQRMLYHQNVSLNNSVFQQNLDTRTQKNKDKISRSSSKPNEMMQNMNSFQSTNYRRDEQKNRSLNSIIDTKNRDILELKKRLQDVQLLKKQNLMLKDKMKEVVQLVSTQSYKLVQYQRQRQRIVVPYNPYPYQNINPSGQNAVIRPSQPSIIFKEAPKAQIIQHADGLQKSSILNSLRLNKSDLVSTNAVRQDQNCSQLNSYSNGNGVGKIQATSVYRCNGMNINQSFYNQKLDEFNSNRNSDKFGNDKITFRPSAIQSSISQLERENRQLRKLLVTKI